MVDLAQTAPKESHQGLHCLITIVQMKLEDGNPSEKIEAVN